jgi:hypothetical protein
VPKHMDLKEIIEKNPNLDLQKLDEWRKLRETLTGGHGVRKRRDSGRAPFKARRAQVVDDAENDPRLIRLQRKP